MARAGARLVVWREDRRVTLLRELQNAAVIAGVYPRIVEKDYAIGWALAGIFSQPELAENWVFKGGTCLRKCHLETYRFSEDLDFTLKDAAQIDRDFLHRALGRMSDWAHARTDLRFPADSRSVDIYKNPQGNISCQCRVGYAGPMAPRSGGLPRIKMDLTADECLVMPPSEVSVRHPYSDAPGTGVRVMAYAFEEVYAEKVRALAERAYPRDLYDVVGVFRNGKLHSDDEVVRGVLEEKCSFRRMAFPGHDDLDRHRGDLEDAWDVMLARQLPALPPVGAFWKELPEFFAWLSDGSVSPPPAPLPLARGDAIIREPTMRLPLRRNKKSHLEIIRFSAANRLCVDLDYDDSRQRVEPYSLRLTERGDLMVHARNARQNVFTGYRAERIQGAQMTAQNFSPRHEIELIPEDLAPERGK